VWAATWLGGQVAMVSARTGADRARELTARRRLRPWLVLEHVSLLVGLLSGLLLMQSLGWGLGHGRWLGLKLGLVAFLLVPLEAMHAWVSHHWIARGLRQTPAPPFARDLARGAAMDDMVRTISALLLGLAVPLLVWLSVRKPF
jgi:hypothetical protein